MSNKEILSWCAYNLELAKDEFEKAGEISNYAKDVLKTADFYKSTITEQEKVISELYDMLERFRPYSKYDEDGEEILLGGEFEYNDGSEELGDEVAALLDKHKQSKGE